VSQSDQILLSAYPISDELRERVGETAAVRFAGCVSISELQALGLFRILAALRGIEAETLWILVSDFGYQPFLPLLRVLASLTRARRLRVVDFEGVSISTSRVHTLLLDPTRLAWWSLKGILTLFSVRREAEQLLRTPRIDVAPIPPSGRVAYLKSTLWFGVQAGGSIGHVAGVANGLSRAGWAVDMLSVDVPPMLDPAIRVRRVRPRGVTGVPLELGRYVYGRAFVAEAAGALAADPPDWLYHRLWIANYAGVALSRRLGVPLVLEYNGSEVWASRNWGISPAFAATAERVEAVSLRHAHMVVTVSEVLRQELLARGVAEERIVCQANGIDPEVFDPARFGEEERRTVRRAWDVPEDAVVVLFLGTFGAWHGTEVLAAAVRRLASHRRDWLEARRVRFVFVGDGRQMPRVRALLAEVPPHLYRLTGLVPQAQAPGQLAAADMLVSPHVRNPDGTRFFGSPTKLFEYMAMGKAIVASDLEQIGEVLAGSPHVASGPLPEAETLPEGACALLTTPGSAEELMAAVWHAAERPELRARLGAAARARALERHTWQRHTEAILARLQELHGTPRGR
jgi:glycosyltransferase involved in cell wall biosynthesis